MSKNLDNKISLILQDCETLSRAELISQLKALVENEIKYHKETHYWGDYELNRIWSIAADRMTRMPMERIKEVGNQNKQRTLCFLDAVVGELRRNELVNFKIEYKK